MEKVLARVIEDIIKKETLKLELARKLRGAKITLAGCSEEILDGELVVKVPRKFPLSGEVKVAGVDSGVLRRSFHGVDIRMSRVAGVTFRLTSGKLLGVEYYPKKVPHVELEVISRPFSQTEVEVYANIRRQLDEVTLARKLLEKSSPDILLLHGSVVPHYTERPLQENELLNSLYLTMVDAYTKLFEACEANDTLLAGVVEDSRGGRLCELLRERVLPTLNLGKEEVEAASQLLEETRDTVMLSYLLKEGERSFAFTYSRSPREHPTLREFERFGEKVVSFYLRTASGDRPVRVDTLLASGRDEERTLETIASLLLSLRYSSRYGMPTVLVEADRRVRLRERDFRLVESELAKKIGRAPTLLRLRREGRPL